MAVTHRFSHCDGRDEEPSRKTPQISDFLPLKNSGVRANSKDVYLPPNKDRFIDNGEIEIQ
jgi:hypothetical protein